MRIGTLPARPSAMRIMRGAPSPRSGMKSMIRTLPPASSTSVSSTSVPGR
jgi:hypothetical protein